MVLSASSQQPTAASPRMHASNKQVGQAKLHAGHHRLMPEQHICTNSGSWGHVTNDIIAYLDELINHNYAVLERWCTHSGWGC